MNQDLGGDMSLYCDGDRCKTKDMTIFYCEDCYLSLQNENEGLREEIASLREELRNTEQA